MKTTVELPDDLVRRVKVRAAEDNRKLKELLAELIERGLASIDGARRARRLPKPLRVGDAPLGIDEIESAIAEGRD